MGHPYEDDEPIGHNSLNATGEELLQIIERWEQLETEKQDIAEQQKEVMSEAKSRGFDTKTIRAVIKRRKKKSEEIAEEEALLETYLTALGMI